ncbi:MAG TPA: ribosome biogenesis GTPase Der [Coriobacteriia bacterium]
MSLPIVAVVGRPNVGKSTLVNRLVQGSDAIVHAMRGVTRDRSYHRTDWNGREFMLIDTGGIELVTDDAFGESIRKQAIMAAEEADAILFVVDGQAGITAGDQDVARILQRSDRPVFLVVNKSDNPGNANDTFEFWNLGIGEPWPISALHGHGTGDLLDDLVKILPESETVSDEGEIGIAIIGRPNAGKSSIFNGLIGVERSIISPVAGTTRDSIDTVVERDGKRYRLVDTAGLRRQSKIDESVEYYSFVRAMRAIDRAQVALLVVDASIGITDGDQRVARFAEERGCAIVVLLNKWDLLTDDDARGAVEDDIPRKLGFIDYAPLLRTSAMTGRGIAKIFDMIDVVYGNFMQDVTTSKLNRFLSDLREHGHTISRSGAQLRVKYGTQTRNGPPGFTFFANHPKLVDENFKRYLENRMREAFDFTGTPVTLKFRQKD